MTAAVLTEKIYSLDEYFELEKHSDIRHEFVNGKLYAMPGESIIANRIADNCGFQLRLQLNKKGYDTIRHDVRTIVKFKRIYRYPDVALAKRSEISQTHAVTKPELLIEVTSDNSTNTEGVRSEALITRARHKFFNPQIGKLCRIVNIIKGINDGV